MNGRKLVSLILPVMLALFAFTACFTANLNNVSLSGIASASDLSPATGRTIVLTIGSPTMYVNGVGQEIDQGYKTAPVIVNGRTFLPIRAIIGDAGTVNWDATQQKVTIIVDNTTVVLYIGSRNATVNGVTKTMEAAPFISSTGRTMLPLRFIIENLNMKVDWYAATRTVVVYMNAQSSSSITVTQPASGVSWKTGSSHTISWSYSNLTGTVSIDLLKSGVTTATITGSASVGSGGTGSYNWTPGSSLAAGSSYQIRVRSNSNTTVSDTGDYFTIADSGPSINITTPTSSTSWDMDSSHTIYWDYSGLDSDTTVTIELLQDGDEVDEITDDADIGSGGSGSYRWTPDSDDLDEADDYQIRITSNEDDDATDTSSKFSLYD